MPEAATLSQLVVYQNGQDQNGTMIEGLDGAVSAVLSGDLLFVTSLFDNALSVWQVNESSGTLRQTALYQDNGVTGDNRIAEVDGRFDGLIGVQDVAVSGDGKLLFVPSQSAGTISVWRVNAKAGTLIQTAIYQDSRVGQAGRSYIAEVDGRVDGLDGPFGAAVSGDGKLLFVPAPSAGTISVWRVNAEAGTLSQTALYQDNGATGGRRIAEVDGRVDGLDGAIGAAVSGDGKLLFVTALSDTGLSDNNALSVWRVNAEAGTLSQTEVYRDGRNGIDGLNGVFKIELSGSSLFVPAAIGDTLSAWHINNAEVSAAERTVIQVQSDMPVAGEVVVTVTARRGADTAAVAVTLSPSTPSADATFPAGTLEPGRWIFTAQATPPALLDTGAARIAMQVLPPPAAIPGNTAGAACRGQHGCADGADYCGSAGEYRLHHHCHEHGYGGHHPRY